MTKLSDLLNEAKGDRSVDSLITEAERRNPQMEISKTARSSVYKALAGDHAKRPRETSLELWATIFNLDVRVVRKAAERPAGELGPWVPVRESAQLGRDQRRALDQLIKTIVQGSADDAAARATTIHPGEDSGDTRVLRQLEPYEVDYAAREDAEQRGRKEP